MSLDMIVFYSENINAGSGELSSEDSKHCYKVLRKKVGDNIIVLDGKGGKHHCEIDAIEKNYVSFIVVKTDLYKPEDHLPTVGISLLKNSNRLEWFLEKATEIGIRSVQPLECKRTLKGKFRKDRAESIVISAMKQCMRTFLPGVRELNSFKEILKENANRQKYICHYSEENDHLLDVLEMGQPAYILIGPEGDFSEDELNLAIGNGWKMVNISNSRLRTETAGITACQIVALRNRGN